LCVLSLGGCLEPLVSDAVQADRSAILAPGSEVPSVERNPSLLDRIDANDGVDGDLVVLRRGFANGEAIAYWDFGTTPDFVLPVYILVQADPAGTFETELGRFEPIAHKVLFDVVPGDAGYTPLWQVVLLPVTEAYAGEVFPSAEALAQGQRAGLLAERIELPAVVNCPVVTPSARLEQGAGQAPLEPSVAYYEGYAIAYFDVGLVPWSREQGVGVQRHAVLRREGGEVLQEWRRGVDFSGDGDLWDSADVFELGVTEANYSSVVREVDVVTVSSLESVDSYRDQTASAVMRFADFFEAGKPKPGLVVAWSEGSVLYNRPIRPGAGE
jgi:hypothetical protein